MVRIMPTKAIAKRPCTDASLRVRDDVADAGGLSVVPAKGAGGKLSRATLIGSCLPHIFTLGAQG